MRYLAERRMRERRFDYFGFDLYMPRVEMVGRSGLRRGSRMTVKGRINQRRVLHGLMVRTRQSVKRRVLKASRLKTAEVIAVNLFNVELSHRKACEYQTRLDLISQEDFKQIDEANRGVWNASYVKQLLAYRINVFHSQQSEDECDHQRCKMALLDLMPPRLQNALFSKCFDFKTNLLVKSGLKHHTLEYRELSRVFRRLTFARDVYQYDSAKEKTMLAFVAGSFPASLAKAVKTYNDIDVFVPVTSKNLNVLEKIWPVFSGYRATRSGRSGVYDQHFSNILSVKNFGKIQIILKYHNEGCLCDFHIDTFFFMSFHHVTRWKLEVYREFYIVRYIYKNDEIVAKKTSIPPPPTIKGVVVRRCSTGRFKIKYNKGTPYPQKHSNNVLDYGPPRLADQALRVYMRGMCKV